MHSDKPIANRIKRRCIIFAVLKEYLSADDTMRALWLLEDRYKDSALLPIMEYVDILSEIVDIEAIRTDVRNRLTKELYFNEQINVDPWNEMQKYRHLRPSENNGGGAPVNTPDNDIGLRAKGILDTKTRSIGGDVIQNKLARKRQYSNHTFASNLSDATVVFNYFVNILYSEIRKYLNGSADSIRNELMKSIPQLGLDPTLVDQLMNWCYDDLVGDFQLDRNYNAGDLSKIIHVFYLWCCDYLGPIQSDRLFSQVIADVEKIPQSVRFSPTRLL